MSLVNWSSSYILTTRCLASVVNLAEGGETVIACILCGGVNAKKRRLEDEQLQEMGCW